MSAVTSEIMDIRKIMSYLPHRYPMLLVDRVEALSDTRCIGIKNVTINEAFFQGHYPGMPIMPGVLIVEAMAQAGAIILLSNPEYLGLVPLIGAIDDVRFKRPVVPGDQLVTEVELLFMRSGIGRLKATARVEGELAAQMELTFKLVPRDDNV